MKQPLPLAVRRIEVAASHQARALAWFREAQDASRRLSAAHRRSLLLRTLEHLLEARRILQETQRAASGDGDLPSTLDQHLARLEQMIVSVGQLVDAPAMIQEQS
jgi:hypothetical protein